MPQKIGNSHVNPDYSMRQPKDEPKKKPRHRHQKKMDEIFGVKGVQDQNALVKPDRTKSVKVHATGEAHVGKIQKVAKVGKQKDKEIDDLADTMSETASLDEVMPQKDTDEAMSQALPLPPSSPLVLSQPMDTSEDLNSIAMELMDLEEDKVPKSSQIQKMIDDLAGFDPNLLPDVKMTESNRAESPNAQATSMDWKSTWKGLSNMVDILTHLESKVQFVEIPDYEMTEMTDADIDMIPVDEVIPDEEMPPVDEDMPEAPQPSVGSYHHVPRAGSSPVDIQPVMHLPSRAAIDPAPAFPPADGSVATPPPRSVDPALVAVARRPQHVPSQNVSVASVPQVGFSHQEGVHQAKQLMQANRFDAAILLLSKIYVGSAQKTEVLELMADCFYQTNRAATALELLQKVAHIDKKNLRVKEKIADCLTMQRQYLKANLIYAVISKKLSVAQADLLKVKIARNNEKLKSLETWPSFNVLMNKIGIDRGQKLTTAELSAITSFQREVNPRAYLMWDIEMNKVKRATIAAMEVDPNVKKFPVYLSDGTTLKDDMGNPIHLYKAPGLALLTHFTKPSLAAKIIDTHKKDMLRAPGEKDPHSFLECQEKICCSAIMEGSQSFYSVNNTAAVGLAIYDPDPLSNILHTWGEDCYTPTYFNAPGIQAATGQSGKEKALQYNEFMVRFQPLTSYVYSVFQHADRIQQQIEVRNQFLELQKDITSRLTSKIKLPVIDALFNKLTSIFPKLDPGKQRLESIISEIEEAIRTNDLGSSEMQENIILKLNSLKDLLQDEGETLRSKAVGKRIKTLFDGITKVVAVREGGEATRTSLYKNPRLKKPLISLYIEETKTLVSNLLRSGMNEDELFTTLFRRPPNAGETVLEALNDTDRSLKTLYENNKKILYKDVSRAPEKNHIWTRTLTPNELVNSVQSGKYSEIGVRGHGASDLVNANHVSFAGIVLEEGMTIRQSGDGYIIDPIRSVAWLSEHVEPKTVEELITEAHDNNLPCFVIGA